MSRLTELASDPILREYMQGAAKQNIQPLANFIAPTVPVAKARGFFKKWKPAEWLKLPVTRRPLKGEATVVGFGMDDARYNCDPHALDFAADIEEKDEASDLMDIVMEGADLIAQLSGLTHEKTVIDLAMASATAGTNLDSTNTALDLVDKIDSVIIDVLKGAKGMGSGMSVRIAWGMNALRKFKNHTKVKDRFRGAVKQGVNPTNTDVAGLFVKPVEIQTTELLVDESSVEDPADGTDFLMGDEVLVFAAFDQPSRYDTSFMKTFRKRGAYMTPRFWTRPDGRVEFAGYDWSEEVQVTNAAAGIKFSITG